MGQINTNNYPAVDSLLDADLLIVENATHGTGTTTPKQLRENAIGTDPLQTTAQTVTGAINEIFEMATDTVVGLELGKMTSFSDGVIVTDIDLHRAPVAGDRILFYHSTSVASPSSLTTYNDGVAVTTTIGDFSMTHPAGLTLMKCIELGESLRWQTVQDIASGYTAGVGISINGTTINNSAPQLGDDIAYSRIDTVTSGALGYFSADADCLVMDFRTDAEPYNGGYTLRLTTTGASFKYAVLKDKAGNNYSAEIPSGSLVLCKSNVSGTGSEADPVVVTVLEIGNTEMAHDVEVLKDICITEKTASGNPITLTDALPYPAVSLSADIKADQDLHGQSAPYVGGSGKNKLILDLATIKANNTTGTWNGNVYSIAGGTVEILTDNANNVTGIKVNGTFNSAVSMIFDIYTIPLTANSYIFTCGLNDDSGVGVDNNSGMFLSNINGNNNWLLSYVDITFRTFTISDPTKLVRCGLYIWEGATVNNLIYYPMIRLSSEQTGFAPYSNICPISGHSSATVDDAGKNQWNYGIATGYGSNSFENSHPVYGNPITVHVKRSNGTGQINYKVYNPDGTTAYNDAALITANNTVANLTIPNNIDGLYLVLYGINGATSEVITELQVAAESSYSSYEPYAHSSVTIQLGQTVYGGTVNLVTGAARIDRAIVDMGDLDWNYSSANVRFQANMPSGYKTPASASERIDGLLCSCYEPNISPIIGTHIDGTISGYEGSITIYVNDSTYSDAALFKTARTGQKILYKLATPIELTLSPVAVEMLKGYNQISSDGGGDITLTYKADRLAAIEAALAALQ